MHHHWSVKVNTGTVYQEQEQEKNNSYEPIAYRGFSAITSTFSSQHRYDRMAASSNTPPDPSWTCFSAGNHVFITTSQHCPEQPYVSLQIGSLTSNTSSPRLSVKRIMFTTVSHDQGSSGTLHLKGTYDQSYTWFDAHAS